MTIETGGCQCGECKKQSASAFSFSIPLSFSRLAVVGQPAMLRTEGFSGAVKDCYFCGKCGTRLWHRSGAAPDNATLKVGTLDEPDGIAPAFHLWTSKKAGWVMLDPAVPAFETQPEDLLAMREEMSRRKPA